MDVSSSHILDRLLARCFATGEIPIVGWYFQIIPMIATPAGLNIKAALQIIYINCFIFAFTVLFVFVNLTSQYSNHMVSNHLSDARMSRFFIDLVMGLGSLTTIFQACLPCVEFGNQFTAFLQSGRHADSILNHIIKNSLAGALSLLEVLQMDTADSDKLDQLNKVVEQLSYTMHWCTSRQVLIDVSSGTYHSVLTIVDVASFLKAMASTHLHSSFKIKSFDIPGDICFDEKMARVVLENVLSNAIAHGNGHTPMVCI